MPKPCDECGGQKSHAYTCSKAEVPFDDSDRIKTEVDGSAAEIILNGKTGAPKDPELIAHVLSAEEAFKLIAEARDVREAAESAAEPFVEAVKAAKKAEEIAVQRVHESFHASPQLELAAQ